MDLIDYIEDEDYIINEDHYLHAFHYEHRHFIDMLEDGIKSPKLLDKDFIGNFNGLYYVSLMKYIDCRRDVYNKLIKRPMFIINSKIRTVHAKNMIDNYLYWQPIIESPLPFRCSPYDNEFQKFLKVKPKDIIRINYNLFDTGDYNISNEEMINRLKTLKLIILDLKESERDLDIVDYSSSKVINKDKVLSLKLDKKTLY